MTAYFFGVFTFLIIAELAKGLSANGTPPFLQRFSWQLDLAYIMWNTIAYIRAFCFMALAIFLFLMFPDIPSSVKIYGPVLFLLWAAVMWLFNFFWVGEYKFEKLTNPKFVKASENKVDLDSDIMGTAFNDEAKAYPVQMVAWHHRIQDEIGGHPNWVTYCAMCRSGRIYDRKFEGDTLDFSIIGAITYNATFKDNKTGSWWRQETGEAIKGPLKGKSLDDMFVEHMSLKDWLEKYPDSNILQYEEEYSPRYNWVKQILDGKKWFPKWQMHKKVQLIAGVDVNDVARAYDREHLKHQRIINDVVGDLPIVLFSSENGRTTLAFERQINGQTLEFELGNKSFRDRQTGSCWSLFGHCEEGELAGSNLVPLQVRQQNIRSWTTFHSNTSIYETEASRSEGL